VPVSVTWVFCFVAPPAFALAQAAEPALSEPALRLWLEAPPACPSERELVDAVMGLVGSAERSLEASVVIHERDGRFQADLALLGGERSVDGATCRAVSAAVVVILALTLDPEARTNVAEFEASTGAQSEQATLRAPKAERLSATPAASPAPPAPARALSAENPAPASDRFALGASALLLVEVGALPAVAFGALGLLRFGRDSWRVELGGGGLFPRAATLPSDPGSGGDIGWVSGQANGCLAPARALSLCLGGELGRISGRGFGVDLASAASATWAAGVATAAGHVDLGREFSLELRLALAVPSSRPTFGVGGEAIHRVSAVSGRMLAGIAFR
jgi:hypothetical protein